MNSTRAFRGITIGLLLSIPLWIAIVYVYLSSSERAAEATAHHDQVTDKTIIKPDDDNSAKIPATAQP